MKRIILPMLLVAAVSCDNIFIDEDGKIFDSKYQAPAIAEGGISQYGHTMEVEDPAEYLGLGYDITDPYLSVKAFRSRVLDMDKYQSIGYSVSTIAEKQVYHEYFHGYRPEDILKKMMERHGFDTADYGGSYLFTGTFSDDFPIYDDPYEWSSAYSFIALCQSRINARSQINGVPDAIRQPQMVWYSTFEEAMESGMSPQEIVEIFGTHVVTTAHCGHSRFDLFRAVSLDKEELNIQDIMHYWKTRIYNDEQDVNVEDVETLAEKSWFGETLCSRFNGGDLNSMPSQLLSMDSSDWYGSLSDDTYMNIVLIQANSLTPIYDFVSDPTMKNQLKSAVMHHIWKSQLKNINTRPLIQITDGINYSFCTEIDYETELSIEYMQGVGLPVEVSVIGTIYAENEPLTIPLYLSEDENGYQRLSNDETDGAQIIGYTDNSTDTSRARYLYEVTDGYHYAYTSELLDSYGQEEVWKRTGKTIRIR